MTDDDRTSVQAVIARLRANPVDFADDLSLLRQQFDALGRPATGQVTHTQLGGIPVLEIPGDPDRGPVFFVHAGGYVAGSAAGTIGLAEALAEATHRRVLSVDYSLAPEHPYPTARDEVVTAYRALLEGGTPARSVSLVGASAGGGLVVQALQRLRDDGDPMPAAAAVISPFSDLTMSGPAYALNADRDPSLTRDGLAAAARHYLAGARPPRPSSEDLRGLPPLQVHVGSLEILLSDALDLTAAAAAADVSVSLEVWPGMVHVFPTFAAVLPEGVQALRAIGAHLDRWSD